MKQCLKRALAFAKGEAVLTIAALLAVGSMAAVPPDNGYLDYIDWDTLALLFSLMAVSRACSTRWARRCWGGFPPPGRCCWC